MKHSRVSGVIRDGESHRGDFFDNEFFMYVFHVCKKVFLFLVVFTFLFKKIGLLLCFA
jgi:hypothetical protein